MTADRYNKEIQLQIKNCRRFCEKWHATEMICSAIS